MKNINLKRMSLTQNYGQKVRSSVYTQSEDIIEWKSVLDWEDSIVILFWIIYGSKIAKESPTIKKYTRYSFITLFLERSMA